MHAAMNPRLLVAALCLCLAPVMRAEDVAAPLSTPLWPEGAPGALGMEDHDIPTLTFYAPAADKASGAAMVIFPGGGYGGLAKHEGEGYARWLTEQGVASFVVKYRLGSKGYRHPAMLNDAARAVRLVRANAVEWRVDPSRIGVMGSSAGGHLVSTILTHFDAGDPDAADPVERLSSRPDLGVLCYAVITMGDFTHRGSRNNLLGADPAPELIEGLSNEKQVTDQTPPCFIWHTWEDNGVKMENSMLFAAALRTHHVPFELHIYEKGGHGIGLGIRDGSAPHRWAADLSAWLRERGFIGAPADK